MFVEGKNMDIVEKEKIFEDSLQKLLQKEMLELEKKINLEIENQIKDELEEYQTKEELVYHKKMEKLDKEYHKQINQLEMESKKEILEEKKNIHKNLKKEIEKVLVDFVQTSEYEAFLIARIEQVLSKIPDANEAVLGLTKQDYEKYQYQIQARFHVQMQVIENQYIGGCVLEDKLAGMYIDNTIQNSINERLEET